MSDKPEFLPLPAGYKMSEERMKSVETVYMTFQDWSNSGYKIIKGSKSTKRNEQGVVLFSSTQVMRVGMSYGDGDEEGEYDDMDWHPGHPSNYGDKD